jgi:hypothetical protein
MLRKSRFAQSRSKVVLRKKFVSREGDPMGNGLN